MVYRVPGAAFAWLDSDVLRDVTFGTHHGYAANTSESASQKPS